MKVNKINWAKCPNCQVLINGYRFYPGHLLMENASNLYSEMECPKCKKSFDIACKVEVTFLTEKIEDKNEA